MFTHTTFISDADSKPQMRSMICSVECYRLFLREQGRKLHQCDENFLRDAQRLIAQELALPLGLTPDQVGPWVREQMGDMSA